MLVVCAKDFFISLFEQGQEGDIQPLFYVGNLEHSGSQGEHQTDQQEKYQHDRTPDKSVQTIVDFCYCF